MFFLQGNVEIGKTLKQVIVMVMVSTLWDMMQVQSKDKIIDKNHQQDIHLFSFPLVILEFISSN